MDVVALISGGKDSCFNMMHCVANGHRICALANLFPAPESGTDELDSFMFQTVGHDLIDLYAECMGVPLFRRPISGASIVQGMDYAPQSGDEVEDLFELLSLVKREMPNVQAVAVGAILSNYQRIRVENVCSRLGLVSLAYLWRRDQKELLQAMIDSGMDAILVKVAAMGLKPSHLGRPISSILDLMCSLNERYGSQICGEGGEYETMTLDAPIFQRRIVIDQFEIVKAADEAFATVAHYRILQAHTEGKVSHGLPSQLAVSLVDTFRTRPLHIEGEDELTIGVEGPDVSFSKLAPRPRRRQAPSEDAPWHFSTSAAPFGDDITKATRHCLDELQSKLAARGLTWSDVAIVHVHLGNMADFGAFNLIYGELFPRNPPARVTVAVPTCLSIECLAADPRAPRENMHVQSISYWAPANIGPYSQTVTIGDCTFVAGQIGLLPHTMNLPRTMEEELSASLSNLSAVISAVGGDLRSNTLSCICYVTKEAFADDAKRSWSLVADRRIPMVVSVVSGLPRDASVEWEVVFVRARSLAAGSEDGDEEALDRYETVAADHLESGEVDLDGAFLFGGSGPTSHASPVFGRTMMTMAAYPRIRS
ncbi:hypothetical protein DFJ74DRAFT_519526 [Hyaloraphidium curvatum]|nr:hypothetical protein DFJ74DRAFT_519526 [Hyaloraphidium curvatum]